MITGKTYKVFKETIKEIEALMAVEVVNEFRQSRTSEAEQRFLDYLRSRGVEDFAIDIVKDLLKRAKPKQDKRGRPKATPNPNLVHGHARTLRRHQREHGKQATVHAAVKKTLRIYREMLADVAEYEHQCKLLDNADKNSAN